VIALENSDVTAALGNTVSTSTTWPGRSGLGKTNTSAMSAAGSSNTRGLEKWSP
jgi:hypothetical protein